MKNNKFAQKYQINENYFNKIDTEDKAYFLGLLYADGYNNEEKYCISINLQELDKDILEKFKISIESNRPLSYIIYKNKKYDNCNRQNQFKLNISNKKLSKQLSRLGCVQRKSLILKFPTKKQVPNKYLKDFIRGYFDGDGGFSLYYDKNNWRKMTAEIISSEYFCYSLKDFLTKKLNIGIWINKSKKAKTLKISGTNQVMKFLDWIYKDSKVYLNRKYNKYKDIRKIICYKNFQKSF